MKKTILLTLASLAAFASSPALAGDSFYFGFSSGGYHAPRQVYVPAPRVVYYQPHPVFVEYPRYREYCPKKWRRNENRGYHRGHYRDRDDDDDGRYYERTIRYRY